MSRRLQATAAERSLQGRAAVNARWATVDEQGRADATSKARAAFAGRFEKQVDPDMQLAPEERARRADAARKAYMQTLAIKSSRARRRAA